MYYNKETEELKVGKIIVHSIIGLVMLMLFWGSFGTISAGEIGIKTRFGAVKGLVQQGLYFKIPFFDEVVPMSIKTLTVSYDGERELGGASKDLQDVAIGVVVNYHIDGGKVQEIFSKYSSVENYQSNVIEPMIREIVKSTSAQYTAEELVTKRAEFSEKVNSILVQQFLDKNAVMERFSVINFQFSQSFSDAIESKVTAVQNAEAAKNKLEQIKFEAQQTIETAKATAEAQRISSAALAAQGGADYVNLKWIEKWNGQLPQQFIPGQALPFLNLK